MPMLPGARRWEEMGEETRNCRKVWSSSLVHHWCDSIRNLTSAPFSSSNSTQSASDTMQAQCRGFSVPWAQFTSAPCGRKESSIGVFSSRSPRRTRLRTRSGGKRVLTLYCKHTTSPSFYSYSLNDIIMPISKPREYTEDERKELSIP